LIVAGTLYTVFAFCWVDDLAIEHPPPRKPESLTIFGGTFFAALVCALADWTKESQFLKIREEIDKERVVVFRGQNPTEREIPSRGLVVGDVIDV
jgi:magnesium-transporting ATPase (P-type)